MRALPLVLAALLFAMARALAPASPAWAVAQVPGRPAEASGPASPAARALDLAAARRRALAGAPASRRPELRRQAIQAAQAVVSTFPGDAEAVEAAFRAGELQRAGGDPEGALASFRRAARLGAGTALGARATYEAGHVSRRAGRWSEALTAYERVHHDEAATDTRRDLAGLWLARSRLELGQGEEGERLLRRLVDDVRDPVTRVRVHDLLIGQLVERGELAAAVGWLDACKRSVYGVSVEQTRRGARVRDALQDMDALELLRVAIAARARRVLR